MRASTKETATNIVLNGERLSVFLLRMGTRQRYVLSPLLFDIVLKVLSTEIRPEKEIKNMQIAKKKNRIFSICR